MLAIIGLRMRLQASRISVFALQRLEEHDVGARLAIGQAALHRAFEALGLARVGASDDQHALGIAPRLAGDLDLLDHVDRSARRA